MPCFFGIDWNKSVAANNERIRRFLFCRIVGGGGGDRSIFLRVKVTRILKSQSRFEDTIKSIAHAQQTKKDTHVEALIIGMQSLK